MRRSLVLAAAVLSGWAPAAAQGLEDSWFATTIAVSGMACLLRSDPETLRIPPEAAQCLVDLAERRLLPEARATRFEHVLVARGQTAFGVTALVGWIVTAEGTPEARIRAGAIVLSVLDGFALASAGPNPLLEEGLILAPIHLALAEAHAERGDPAAGAPSAIRLSRIDGAADLPMQGLLAGYLDPVRFRQRVGDVLTLYEPLIERDRIARGLIGAMAGRASGLREQ